MQVPAYRNRHSLPGPCSHSSLGRPRRLLNCSPSRPIRCTGMSWLFTVSRGCGMETAATTPALLRRGCFFGDSTDDGALEFPGPGCRVAIPLHAVSAARPTPHGNHIRTLFITPPFRLVLKPSPHHRETSIGPHSVSCARARAQRCQSSPVSPVVTHRSGGHSNMKLSAERS